MSEIRLRVNQRLYAGWKSVQVTRSMETIAGSFALDVSDRWIGQDEPWPIREEDACRVEIDDTVVIDGYVSQRSQSISGTARTLSYAGKDRSAALMECSAVLDRWSFRNATVKDIATAVCAPFGIAVSVQTGLSLDRQRKLVINPGDSAFNVIERAALAAGVLAVSDGAGGLTITRSGTAGTARATPIEEGVNLLAGSVEYNAEERYARYLVTTQTAGTDNASGGATRIRAEATDESVRRAERVLMLHPSSGLSSADARRRADWEARIRAARAETVTVTVQGWTQPGGAVWPINALVSVRAPSIGVDGEMLIAQADYSLSEAGELTTLRLVRPDAFTPEPQAKVKSSGSFWKTL